MEKTTPMIDTFAALPVGTWLDILAAQEANPDPVDRQVATLALLTGLSEKRILALPIAEYSDLARRAEFLATAPVRLPRAAKTYKVGEWTLRVQGDLRKITAAQYIDFQTFAPQGDAALVELLSVVLIPDDAPGYNDGYDIAAVQTAIRADLSVDDALALAAFFLSKYAALIRSTETSLKRLTRRERNPQRREAMESRLAILTEAREKLTAGLTTSLVAGDGLPKWTE